MDINQTMNSQSLGIDLNQPSSHKPLLNERSTPPKTVKSENAAPVQPDATTVSLSKEGQAAAAEFDFSAIEKNLSKLTVIGGTDEFTKSHAAVSYANVMKLLS